MAVIANHEMFYPPWLWPQHAVTAPPVVYLVFRLQRTVVRQAEAGAVCTTGL